MCGGPGQRFGRDQGAECLHCPTAGAGARLLTSPINRWFRCTPERARRPSWCWFPSHFLFCPLSQPTLSLTHTKSPSTFQWRRTSLPPPREGQGPASRPFPVAAVIYRRPARNLCEEKPARGSQVGSAPPCPGGLLHPLNDLHKPLTHLQISSVLVQK